MRWRRRRRARRGGERRRRASSSGCAIVVEVSPCTTATRSGRTRRIASSIADAGTAWPHSASTTWTSPPQRAAISVSRCPNRPKTGTSTRAPGSTSETSAASIPAREVPSTRNVCSLLVANSSRYRPIVSVIVAVIHGSYWPTSGVERARSTRGSALTGPGPMSSRAGGSTGITGDWVIVASTGGRSTGAWSAGGSVNRGSFSEGSGTGSRWDITPGARRRRRRRAPRERRRHLARRPG